MILLRIARPWWGVPLQVQLPAILTSQATLVQPTAYSATITQPGAYSATEVE